MRLFQALNLFFGGFDRDELRSGFEKLLSGVASCVTEAAEDDVSGDLIDALLHAASPEWVGDFDFDDKRGDDGKNIHRGGDAEDHDEHVEDAESWVVGGIDDLSVADAGDGDNGHIQRLQEVDAVAAEREISDYAERDETEEEYSCE